ncbi:MAG TPA: hypothetical protein VFQ65_00365 [Kofleriaceae bacterium]|nr:hypothetical protein [Kofleriaceae bacterium]
MRRALFIPIVGSLAFAVSACELYFGGNITTDQAVEVPDAGQGPCDHDGGNCYTVDAGSYGWDGGYPTWDAYLAPDGGCNGTSDGGSYDPDAGSYGLDGGWIHPVDAH